MSLTPTYPGIYIQELPSGTRTITPVATAITSFIGSAQRGPIDSDSDSPVTINSFGDFQQMFGGLWQESNMSYAVNQFYQNGGGQALIVRVVNGATPATFTLAGCSWKLEAANPGAWGAELYAPSLGSVMAINTNIDPSLLAADPTLFNLLIVDVRSDGTTYTETYLNLSADATQAMYAPSVLAQESQVVAVVGGAIPQPPVQPPAGTWVLDAGTATDGAALTAANIIGVEAAKSGIYALQKAALFNLVCIPPYNNTGVDITTGDLYTLVYPAALSYFTDYNKRAILLVDPPSDWVGTAQAVSGINTLSYLRSLPEGKNAAIYFPRIQMADPLLNGRPREFVPSGAIAGIIAQTDSTRGVWKAPAGIAATFSGVLDLTDGGFPVRLTDQENGELNPLGVNCLRLLPVVGPAVWGARTLRGADMLADQWKYLSIRRTAQFIEETLYENLNWVVFEPNDEPLWKSIRLNVGAFMQQLFIQGAFQGTTPTQAYLVKCDSETNPQYLIDQGIVTILVGFAPLYPAEFVILQIQQMTAQAGS
ncbi:MAG: phage tail sheath subtilisin-like domain-containing protein [Thaumarchaeota archaeon]|nr:phage tail sheath subtilisin-like domain-containing protein [Nitrososphaerota archaeon]